MRVVLVLLLIIHGLIHLFGFIKAFNLGAFDTISEPSSKSVGIIWLLSSLLFITAPVLFILKSNYWWALAILAVIVSQVLIFSFWTETKFGTLANFLIITAALLSYGEFKFKNQIQEERTKLLSSDGSTVSGVLKESHITHLPMIVQTWLRSSGALGRPLISNVHLKQDILLKLKPEQKKWNKGTAEQYFTIEPPAFHWTIESSMSPLLTVSGRDRFELGQGAMLIKLFSIFPIVDAKNTEKINQASLQRYLAEMVWFPSAALSPYISWEHVDEHSAKASLNYQDTQGSGTFYFNEDGSFKKFVTMRYRDTKDSEPSEWTVEAMKTEEHHGIKIPVACEARWKLEKGDWAWLQLNITDIEYNVPSLIKKSEL